MFLTWSRTTSRIIRLTNSVWSFMFRRFHWMLGMAWNFLETLEIVFFSDWGFFFTFVSPRRKNRNWQDPWTRKQDWDLEALVFWRFLVWDLHPGWLEWYLSWYKIIPWWNPDTISRCLCIWWVNEKLLRYQRYLLYLL